MQIPEWNSELGEWVYREMTPEEEAAWILASTPPPPTETELWDQINYLVQSRVDRVAMNWRYVNMADAVSYADESSVPKYAAEALVLRAWRSACRRYAENLVVSNIGVSAMPSEESIIAGMPTPPVKPVDPVPDEPVESDPPQP